MVNFALFGVWAVNQHRTDSALLRSRIELFKAANATRFSKDIQVGREQWKGELHMVLSEVWSSSAGAQGPGVRPPGLIDQPSPTLKLALLRLCCGGRRPKGESHVGTHVGKSEKTEKAAQLAYILAG